MAKKATAAPIDKLSPTQFENLTFDLMMLRGMSNVRWRTPGADGGRDIEGETSVIDFSGHQKTEKWYVECKHYASAIGWPTVYEKISHADAASADALLICTQSTFSPTAITRTQEWNDKQDSLKVRLWPRHDLELRLGEHPDLQIKYGLSKATDQSGSSITQLSLTIFKTLTSYCANQEMLGASADRMLEAARALSSLIHKKMEDVELVGYARSSVLKTESDEFVDIVAVPDSQLDRHGVIAYAHLLAALTSSRVTVESADKATCFVRTNPTSQIAATVARHAPAFNSICFWSSFDATVSSTEIALKQREALA